MNKKIFIIGIITCILYFVAVAGFMVFKTEVALTIWELLTVLSAPVVMIVLYKLQSILNVTNLGRTLTNAFMACTFSLTAIAHFVNIAVTRPLINQGVNVPTYFQIGYWPSVEMAVDYVAWGFFCGLAFLSLAIFARNKQHKNIIITTYICAILCQIGFWGAMFINENLWYLAPWGYGLGFMILCIQALLTFKNAKNC
jgi:hypothetical protein